ncbi:hypothetical protein MHAS_01880 [Mycolicibacterium hassiacum DSM 44199]|uniref:DUF7159 family protein n=1 Tax=Mycolicibacterium hassiacum TaxID=46351 RepID=UPI000A98A8D8|nr:hypothetical protein MHAS_01880 [Mycolicibacterium hassiacum DSM 44199]
MVVDAVLGLSVTPTAVGLVLVEGPNADGATVDREAFEIVRGRHEAPEQTAEQVAAAVLRVEARCAERGDRLRTIGLTWSDDARKDATLLLRSLGHHGFDDTVAVRMADAAEALTWGVADAIGREVTAVCLIEPDTVMVIIAHAGEAAVQSAVRSAPDDEHALAGWLHAVFTRAEWPPEALVLAGSGGGLDELMPLLEAELAIPVYTPADAELALARGAALAAEPETEFAADTAAVARVYRAARSGGRPPGAVRYALPVGMLTAGAVGLVVSVSAAVALEVTPDRDDQPRTAARTAADVSAVAARARTAKTPAPAAPVTSPPAAAAPPAPPREPERVVLEVPPEQSAVGSAEPPAAIPDGDAAQATAGGEPVVAPVGPAPAPPSAALSPGVEPAPGLVPAVPTPVPQQRPGILRRIKDRLSGIGWDPPAEQGPQPPAGAEAPAPEALPAPPPEAPAAPEPAPQPAPPPEAPPPAP